jgi:predicted AlkP superfamily pyrophosphatase or phosphodiesterase
MAEPLVLLSIPGLREKDVAAMGHLRELTAGGEIAELTPSFPCVTCPVQANMTTGRRPSGHGVVANGVYWRDRQRVEMWTSPNECVDRPQLWDLLSQHDERLKSAVWFPLHAKGAEADYICTPSPIHNPDGTESLWCYTRPLELYGTLRDELGHFPLQNFWGPMANIGSTGWIASSAVYAAKTWHPQFFYIYLPHLDYAAQRHGPDSPAADAAVIDLDKVIGRLAAGMKEAYGEGLMWLVAGEYAITAVDHVVYPNRVLREAGLLRVREENGAEEIDFAASRAWALADHQHSHVFVSGGDEQVARQVGELFRDRPGIAEVLVGVERHRYHVDHPRSGDVILISTPNSWQAYYWWLADDRAPAYARSVDIHRKPGYDPVELFVNLQERNIPLDATLVKGSHGAPAVDESQKTVVVASQPYIIPAQSLADTDIFDMVLRHFGV